VGVLVSCLPPLSCLPPRRSPPTGSPGDSSAGSARSRFLADRLPVRSAWRRECGGAGSRVGVGRRRAL